VLTPTDDRLHGSPWPPPTVAAARQPEGWYDDPRGRAALRWWDGAGWTDHEHGMATLPWRAAAIGVAALAAVRIVVDLAAWPIEEGDVPLWLVATVFYLVVFGVMVLVARRWLWPGGSAWGWLRNEVRAVDLGWGVLAWLTTIATAVLLVSLMVGLGVPFRSNASAIDLFRDRDTGLFVVTMIAAVVGAPLVEEVFFRGLLLRGGLRALPPWGAIALQGVVFGVYHVIPSYGRDNIGLVLVLSAYGCVFGAFTYRMGRIGPAIVGHAITNSLVLLLVLAR
jgi:membrane protease YdiL (CAAX protease family)